MFSFLQCIANALEAIDNRRQFGVTEDHVGNFVSTQSVYLRAGQRIRIAFASIVNVTSAANPRLVTNYDLYLYAPTGSPVLRSQTQYNNEFIDYFVPLTGMYEIKILQAGEKQTSQIDFG